jgi:FkbM family methyltransferase
LVLDGGANSEQYAIELCRQGYRGRIVSFEPQLDVFTQLKEASHRDGNWSAVNIGLGDENSEWEINVFADSVYGSLLQPLGRPATPPMVSRQVVPIRRLDAIWNDHCWPDEKVFLKLDVQGYEKKILAGAGSCLEKLVGIQIEMSLVPQYQGQPEWEEMLQFMRVKGFSLWKIEKGTWDPKTGRESELDGIFFREPASVPGRS